MNDYQGNRVPGPTYFFTVRLDDPHSALLTDHISAFGEAIRLVRTRKPFHVDAWVVLPDHAHAIWTLPPGDHDCATRWRAVKIAFSKSLRKSGLGNGDAGAIWTRRYQHLPVPDEAEYRRLVDCVHRNPLRHGMCQRPEDWPWSSLHRFVAAGYAIPT
ncbi:transposase [Massilia sp. RP-1-19]|uniref:Transposase n=1 Tax=Massilia polaris TaxID=2728846 RepID=A0A848HJT8_9BURK|nr:transposase [Massilia polaris]NML60399.1 transposase [Massilia polaris]